ncbi:MAG: glycosyltransferase [Marinobacterium sp.]
MSADKPRVAVLMAVCNGLPWIEEQVESILAQRGVQLDLYISVDESADNTESFCTELESKEPRVRVLQGSGPGSACGNFVRLMREVSTHSYEYIALADQDDIWQDDKLERGISCLENMAADAYSSSFIAFWGTTGQQRFIDKSAPQREYDYLFESPGPGCSFILKPHLVEHFCSHFREISLADIQRVTFHDWLIYAFARSHGYSWFIDQESRLLYRQHENNVLGVNSGVKAQIKRLQNMLSGAWLEQALLIADFIGMREHSFVVPWRQIGPRGVMFLIRNSGKIRRRLFDRMCLALILPFMMLSIRCNNQKYLNQ